MRLLYITGSMPPLKCGIGYYSSQFLRHLPKRVKIQVLTTEGCDTESSLYGTVFTSSWRIFKLPSLMKTIRQFRPDIVNLQYPAKGYKRNLGINLLPYFLIRYPLVVTLHELHGSGLLGRTRNLITTLPAKKIVVSNHKDFDALPYLWRRKAEIVPIGSNIEKSLPNKDFYSQILKDAGFSQKKAIGVFFGFAFPNKGLDLLFDAVKSADSQLLLLTNLDGANAYQNNLLKRYASLKNRGVKIYYPGFMDDIKVSQILRECDYFVLPQPLPLTAKSGTAIAAAIHGLTIVSTGDNDKTLNEPYVHNENSILLNPMNHQTLTRALSELHNNTDILKELRSGAKKLSDYFDWQKIVEKHEDLWKRVRK